MRAFIARRILIMIPMMLLASVICFWITELQPGDFVSQYLDNPQDITGADQVAQGEAGSG